MSIVCSTSNLNNIDKSTPTNYQLVFPKIPTETTIGANNPFVMNIHSAIVPSVSLAVEELRWQGLKTNRGLTPIEFDPWLVSFTVDSNLANWNLLRKWMQFINNNRDKIAEYHSEYSVDASMIITDNYGNMIKEIIFIDIWPMQIGEISFSQREGDVLLESTVNFNYDYFKVRSTAWTDEFSSSSKSSSSKSWASSSSSSLSSSSSSSSSSLSSSSSSSSSSKSSSSISLSSSSSQSSSSDAINGAWYGYNPDPLVTGNEATANGLIDGDIYQNNVFGYVDPQNAMWFGGNLEELEINNIKVYGHGGANDSAWWGDGVVGVYKSNNRVNWTHIQTDNRPTVFQASDGSGDAFGFRIDFSSTQKAYYFKLRNNGNDRWGTEGGNLLYPVEIQVTQGSYSSSSSSVSVSSSSSSESTTLPLSANLYTYWSFDGDYTDKIGNQDATGNGTDFTSTAIINQSVNIDSGDNVFGGTSLLSGWTQFSISFWVYFDTLPSNDEELIRKANTHNSSAPFLLWRDEAATNHLAWLINDDGLDYSGVQYSDWVPSTGSWNHIVFTFDANNEVHLYINGTEDTASPWTITLISEVQNGTDDNFVLGKNDDSDKNFDGKMDEFGIWYNRVLTSDEVSQLYNSGNGLGFNDLG